MMSETRQSAKFTSFNKTGSGFVLSTLLATIGGCGVLAPQNDLYYLWIFATVIGVSGIAVCFLAMVEDVVNYLAHTIEKASSAQSTNDSGA
jgi:hypothetical protein